MWTRNILFAFLLLLKNYETLADFPKNTNLVGELQHSVEQCYGFCDQIKPLLDHVSIYQPQRVLGKNRINVFEAQLKNMEQQLAALKAKRKKPNLEKFIKFDSRYYHIGNVNKLNWFAAFQACRQIGASLAIIENNNELVNINFLVRERSQYWLANNYLIDKGHLRIWPFSKEVFFGDWWWDGALAKDGQGCLYLYESGMWDTECNKKHYYICEAVIDD